MHKRRGGEDIHTLSLCVNYKSLIRFMYLNLSAEWSCRESLCRMHVCSQTAFARGPEEKRKVKYVYVILRLFSETIVAAKSSKYCIF
jgi:hypothetical protein